MFLGLELPSLALNAFGLSCFRGNARRADLLGGLVPAPGDCHEISLCWEDVRTVFALVRLDSETIQLQYGTHIRFLFDNDGQLLHIFKQNNTDISRQNPEGSPAAETEIAEECLKHDILQRLDRMLRLYRVVKWCKDTVDS